MVNLEARNLCFSYFNRLVLRDLNLTVTAGEMVGLLGPNGSGKTTLLKLTSGVLKPTRGEIRLDGMSLDSLNRRSIARSVAVVPQQFPIPYAFSVGEVVMLGRTPYIKPFARESDTDRRVSVTAMELTGISHLAQRRFEELSGGEQQKVILAMALAQEPGLLLLDEPTVHLDISHQVEILDLVKRLNAERGITVIAAMHDLNLAAMYFDRLLLLNDGSISAEGTPAQVLTEDKIGQVFSASVKVGAHPVTGAPHVVVMPGRSTRT